MGHTEAGVGATELCFCTPCAYELGSVVLALFSQRTTRTALSDGLPTKITSSNPKMCTMHHLARHADAHRMVRWGRSDQRWKAELEVFKSVWNSQASRLREGAQKHARKKKDQFGLILSEL
jgi:hypothetical protein